MLGQLILDNWREAMDQLHGLAHVAQAEALPRESASRNALLDLNRIEAIPATPAVPDGTERSAATTTPGAAGGTTQLPLFNPLYVQGCSRDDASGRVALSQCFPRPSTQAAAWATDTPAEAHGDATTLALLCGEATTVSAVAANALRRVALLRPHVLHRNVARPALADAPPLVNVVRCAIVEGLFPALEAPAQDAGGTPAPVAPTRVLSGTPLGPLEDALLDSSSGGRDVATLLEGLAVNPAHGTVACWYLAEFLERHPGMVLCSAWSEVVRVLSAVAVPADSREPVVVAVCPPITETVTSNITVTTDATSEATRDAAWRLLVSTPSFLDLQLSITRMAGKDAMGHTLQSTATTIAAEVAVVETEFVATADDQATGSKASVPAVYRPLGAQGPIAFAGVTLLSDDAPTWNKAALRHNVMLCSVGAQTIQLQSTLSVPQRTVTPRLLQWAPHAVAAAQYTLRVVVPRIIAATYRPSPLGDAAVLPVFQHGLRLAEVCTAPPGDAADHPTLASTRTRLGIRAGDWQHDVVVALFRALCTVCSAQSAASYLMRRWRLDWVSVLQGVANEPQRALVTALCTFVADHAQADPSAAPNADASQCAKCIMQWLVDQTTPDVLLRLLEEKQRNADTVSCVLKAYVATFAASQSSVDHLMGAWLTDIAPASLFDPFHGASSTACAAIQDGMHDALHLCSAETASHIARMHTFEAEDLERVLFTRPIVSIAAVDAPAIDAASGLLEMNTLVTNKPGVRITTNATGALDVERTAMGPFCLRGIRSWSLHPSTSEDAGGSGEGARSYYFEARLGEMNIKRVLVGLCSPQDVIDASAYMHSDVRKRSWFLDSNGKTPHCVAFGCGDVVGYGMTVRPAPSVAGEPLRTCWCTLNGTLLFERHMQLPAPGRGVHATTSVDRVVPFVAYDTTDRSNVTVNFGQAPFVYQGRALRTAGVDASQSTRQTYEALCAQVVAEPKGVLHAAMLSQALSMQRPPLDVLEKLAHAPQLTRKLAKQLLQGALALVDRCAPSEQTTSPTPTPRTVQWAMNVAATLLTRHCPLPALEGPQGVACLPKIGAELLAAQGVNASRRCTYHPVWIGANEETSFVSGNAVQVLEKQHLSHAVASPLPSEGIVSFSVCINHSGTEQRMVQNYGQFYIGVTTLSVSELGSGSWQDVAAQHSVWGVHSISSAQLPQCNDAAFAGDSYTFSSNSVVTIHIDRERGTMDLSRAGKTFTRVFDNIPSNVVLHPFVQLVEEKTSAVIMAGQRDVYLSTSRMLEGALVRLTRAMLRRSDTAGLVEGQVARLLWSLLPNPTAAASSMNAAVAAARTAQTTRMVMGILGGGGELAPGSVVVVTPQGDRVPAVAQHIDEASGMATVVSSGGSTHWLPVDLIDAGDEAFAEASAHDQGNPSAHALVEGSDDEVEEDPGDDVADAMAHRRSSTACFIPTMLQACIETTVHVLAAWGRQVLQPSLIHDEELSHRQGIEEEEAQASSAWRNGASIGTFRRLLQLNGGLMSGLYQNATVPTTHTFSPHASSPELSIPRHYNGKLVLSPPVAPGNGLARYVAIANEAVPAKGLVNIRMRIEFDWMGLLPLGVFPMAEGTYIGLCSESYHGDAWELPRVQPPQTWAMTSQDNGACHLPHSCKAATHARQLFSGDVVRLQVHREKGTMEVFRTPAGRAEVSLGILFRDVPKDANLFPFVQIASVRTAVMFLPESAALPRAPHNAPRLATTIKSKGHACDGCLNQMVHAAIEAPHWYRCNQCLDFDLCATCFQGHFHCGHTFTHMRPVSFLPSPVVDRHAACVSGTDVEMSSAPVVPLTARRCTIDVASHCLTATVSPHLCSTDDDALAFAMWGILRKPASACEIAVSFRPRTLMAGAGPVDDDGAIRFIAGIAPLSRLERHQSSDGILNDIRSQAAGSNACFAVFATDGAWGIDPGVLPTATRQRNGTWLPKDEVLFHVRRDNVTEVRRNGSVCRLVPSTKHQWAADEPLALFFVMDNPTHHAVEVVVSTQQGPTLVGKVGEVSGTSTGANFLRVTNGTANRWCTASQLHMPLEPLKQHSLLRVGLCVLVVDKAEGRFVECVVTSFGDVDQPIVVHDGTHAFPMSLDGMYVPHGVNCRIDPDEAHMYPDVKRRLRRFYAQYAPTKTDEDIDKAIDLYAKRSSHARMWEDLVKKYGPEPALDVVLPRPTANLSQLRGLPPHGVLPAITLLRLLHRFCTSASGRPLLEPLLPSIAPLLDHCAALLDAAGAPKEPVAQWHRRVAANATLAATATATTSGSANVVLSAHLSAAPLDDASMAPLNAPMLSPSTPRDGASMALQGSWEGLMESTKGFQFRVVLDCTDRTAMVSFACVGSASDGRYCIGYHAARIEWHAVTREVAVALSQPDDEEAARLLALLVSEPHRTTSCVPLTLQATEALLFVGQWQVDGGGFAEGEWKTCHGQRGYGTLRMAQGCPPPPLAVQWPLPPPSRLTQAAPQTPHGAEGEGAGALLSYVASCLRLECPATCYHSGTSPTSLLKELAAALPRLGVVRFEGLLRGLPAEVQTKVRHAATLTCCSSSEANLATRVAAARALAALPCATPDVFWLSLYSVVCAAHRQWNSIDILEALATLTANVPEAQRPQAATLLAPLHSHVAAVAQGGFASTPFLSVASDVFGPLAAIMRITALPVKGIAMLVDVAAALQVGTALPLCVDSPAAQGVDGADDGAVLWSTLGEHTTLQRKRLVAGTVYSRLAPPSAASLSTSPPLRYVEVSADDTRVVVALCLRASLLPPTTAPAEPTTTGSTPSSKPNHKLGPVLGFQPAGCIAFDGTTVFVNGRGTRLGHCQVIGNETLGMLVDVAAGRVTFSVNGLAFDSVAMPDDMRSAAPLGSGMELLVAIRASRSVNGSTLRSELPELLSLPQGAEALHKPLEDCSATYAAGQRSSVGAWTVAEWVHRADVTSAPQGENVDHRHDVQRANVVQCIRRTMPYVDLMRETSPILRALPTLKRLMGPALRNALTVFPPLETGERSQLPQVSIRWFSLYAYHTRTPDEALSHTVLAQLYRQLGASPRSIKYDPMFVTALMMTESNHTPIDAGGPYNQAWSLIAEELMTDTASGGGGTTAASGGEAADGITTQPGGGAAAGSRRFYRNPLFRFGNSAKKGKVLVPDATRCSAFDLQLFAFFGALMGYTVRAKRCLALELSPVVWRFVTEEPLTPQDFVDGVDANIAACLDDEAFLCSKAAEVMFPGIGVEYQSMAAAHQAATDDDGAATTEGGGPWRRAAESCLVRSLDPQLTAIRRGVWSTLPRSTTRLLSPEELALRVCGEPFPTMEQLTQSIVASLPEPFADMFWRAMRELSPAEWSAFFYFASAQRRYPLSRKITVTPTKQSETHIPQASTCFNHVSTPLYQTVEQWVAKLRQAISCQDMELA